MCSAPKRTRDRVFEHSQETMDGLPDNSVALMVTSPPYHVGKDYDTDTNYDNFLQMLNTVFTEAHRVFEPGGRASCAARYRSGTSPRRAPNASAGVAGAACRLATTQVRFGDSRSRSRYRPNSVLVACSSMPSSQCHPPAQRSTYRQRRTRSRARSVSSFTAEGPVLPKPSGSSDAAIRAIASAADSIAKSNATTW